MNSLYHNLTVTVHANLLDLTNRLAKAGDPRAKAVNGSNAIVLWYYLRARDTAGRGYAEFTIECAMKDLEKSRATVYRYLSEGKALGFFRDYGVVQGKAWAYLQGLNKITKQYCGTEGWGVAAEVQVSDLRNHKIIAAEMTIASLQRSSEYMAQRHNDGLKRQKKVLTNDVFVKASQFSRGATVRVGKKCVLFRTKRGKLVIRSQKTFVYVSPKRFLFVGSQVKTTGVSQKRVGEALNRHELTIRRRVATKQRAKKGLEPVMKRQVAQLQTRFKPEDMQWAIDHQPEFTGIQLNKYFCLGSGKMAKIYKVGCNIYDFSSMVLKSCRMARHFYLKSLKTAIA